MKPALRNQLLGVLYLIAAAAFGLGGRLSAQEPNAAAKELESQPARADQAKLPVIFDGKSLEGWRVVDVFDFKNRGKSHVKDGVIHLERGNPATGISWKGDFPRSNYEVLLEGQRVAGNDFFCGLTFPVKKQHCTLVLGGWGGQVVGLSNIDSYSAIENETTQAIDFKQGRWYKIRLRVSDADIRVWIDGHEMITVETADREFSLYWEQEPVTPLGIVTWHTHGAIRNLKLQPLAKVDDVSN